MRSASNGSEVCQHLNAKLNLNIHLLSGDQSSALNDLSNSFPADGSYLFVDVGGGSTELFYKNSSNVMFKSLNLGAVKLFRKRSFIRVARSRSFFSLLVTLRILLVSGGVRSLILLLMTI